MPAEAIGSRMLKLDQTVARLWIADDDHYLYTVLRGNPFEAEFP